MFCCEGLTWSFLAKKVSTISPWLCYCVPKLSFFFFGFGFIDDYVQHGGQFVMGDSGS
jgi:hypothetical protein